MLDHLEVMREAVSIRRAEHPGWVGLSDSAENTDSFLRTIGRDMPEAAHVLAQDLRNNANDFSDEIGVSPDRVRYYANRLIDGIKSKLDELNFRQRKIESEIQSKKAEVDLIQSELNGLHALIEGST